MSDDSSHTDAPDPKQRMREALERKQAQHHRTAEAANDGKRTGAGPHGPLGGKRTFRRKAGG